MGDSENDNLLKRILAAIGGNDDEVAAGHGAVPSTRSRPSTRSPMRSREQQRERADSGSSEMTADAIAEAAAGLDDQIRESIGDSKTRRTSEEMVKRAGERWSSD